MKNIILIGALLAAGLVVGAKTGARDGRPNAPDRWWLTPKPEAVEAWKDLARGDGGRAPGDGFSPGDRPIHPAEHPEVQLEPANLRVPGVAAEAKQAMKLKRACLCSIRVGVHKQGLPTERRNGGC